MKDSGFRREDGKKNQYGKNKFPNKKTHQKKNAQTKGKYQTTAEINNNNYEI